MLLLLTSLTSSAFGHLELIWVRKKNWWKDMGFLDTPPPFIYKNKQIHAFQGTQGTQCPGTGLQLMVSCLLKRNLTQMSFVKPLFSAKLVFFQKFWKIFLYLWNFVSFSLLSFSLLQNALSNLFWQTIWICEQFPIHYLFRLELHIFFSPADLWNAVHKKKLRTSKWI